MLFFMTVCLFKLISAISQNVDEAAYNIIVSFSKSIHCYRSQNVYKPKIVYIIY